MKQYPELGSRRVVDVIDAASGDYLCEIKDVRYEGIMSVSVISLVDQLIFINVRRSGMFLESISNVIGPFLDDRLKEQFLKL